MQEDSIEEMEKMLNQRSQEKASLEKKKESESSAKLEETNKEEEAEEIKEEDLVYLGMGLWEKKKPKEENETDPLVVRYKGF